ncbi:hypothetical protein NV379_22245 [Paenibacillus sp. N1-5-1-14]|uniref:hypothetical protein n=1 Tax=Paenibacillus radicibacter TaxID=2972488 RepID=UPI002159AB3B|nr:hypothetical protein [Paenibacillus radicibacter]MCR8645363.1 hypothetical protein [Paenibacillus radicibacter]
MRWCKNGEWHRLEQPVGKQYCYGKGTEVTSEIEMLTLENRYLKQQLDVLKKYKELEKWVESELVVACLESFRGELNISRACE